MTPCSNRRFRTRRVKGALRSLCLSDDPWATRPAVELLCSGFTSTAPEILTITPADADATAIGHLGFFRPEHRDTLWRGAAEWLEAEGEAPDASSYSNVKQPALSSPLPLRERR